MVKRSKRGDGDAGFAIGLALVLPIRAGLGVKGVFAQQVQVKKNFEAEIQTAIESAKTAAGFEFLGTLVRTLSVVSSPPL